MQTPDNERRLLLELAYDFSRREPILRSLETYPSSYGHEKLRTFIDAFTQSIMDHPARPHILVVVGEPVSVKSNLLLEIFQEEIVHPSSKFGRWMHNTGYLPQDIDVSSFSWGESFYEVPENLQLDGIDYHTDPILKRLKQMGVDIASDTYERVLAETIQAYGETNEISEGVVFERKKIRILLADIPANCGDEVQGVLVGLRRGQGFLRNLARHEGSFQDLDYEVFMGAISAKPDVRAKGKQDRMEAKGQESLIEKIRTLRKRGFNIKGRKEEVNQYFKESAGPFDIEMNERDTNEYLLALTRAEMIPDVFSQYDRVNSPDFFRYRPSERAEAISLMNIVFLRDSVGQPSEKAVVLVNNKLVNHNLEMPNNMRRPLVEDARKVKLILSPHTQTPGPNESIVL